MDFTVVVMDEHAPPPWEPPLAGGETEQLIAALDRLRTTFRWKTDGLDAAGLAAAPVASSALTIGGLLKHLTLIEATYVPAKMFGEPPGEPWDSVDWEADPEWEFRTAAGDGPAALYASYDAAVARSRTRLARGPTVGGLEQDAQVSDGDGRHASLRRVVCDLIEEYGRHTGQADLIREAVDGRVGEDPPGPALPYPG